MSFTATQLGFTISGSGGVLYLVSSNALRIIDAVEFNGSGPASHVPEIGMPSFELGLRPGEHDAVLMIVIARIVVRDDVPGR